jgi:hypothetical protein
VVEPQCVPIAALYGAKLTLVRPDQHVAWRGDHWTGAHSRATGVLFDSIQILEPNGGRYHG